MDTSSKLTDTQPNEGFLTIEDPRWWVLLTGNLQRWYKGKVEQGASLVDMPSKLTDRCMVKERAWGVEDSRSEHH